MWPWRVKIPTQNLLRLLMLLMLMMRIVLATDCCILGSWGLVKESNFCSIFQQKVSSRFWSWSSGRIFELEFGQHFAAGNDICRGYEVESWLWYFGKLNSTLGSVMPLAMLYLYHALLSRLPSAEAATAALELTAQQRIHMWRVALSVDLGGFVWNFKRFRQFVSQHGTKEWQK